MSDKKVCFVVSPIGESGSDIRKRADQVLKHIIEPVVLTECMYDDVIRADKISNPGSITHQIIDHVINADLVIADLTGLNPNVFYELAIRHALRKPYVQICDQQTRLPFDVQTQRTIFFDYKDLDSVEEAKRSLKSMIDLASQGQIMTPIHEGLVISNLVNSENNTDRILGELVKSVSTLSEEMAQLKRFSPSKISTSIKVPNDYRKEVANDIMKIFMESAAGEHRQWTEEEKNLHLLRLNNENRKKDLEDDNE